MAFFFCVSFLDATHMLSKCMEYTPLFFSIFPDKRYGFRLFRFFCLGI